MKDHVDNQHAIATTGHQILKRILTDYHGPVAVRLWDGELSVGDSNASCTVVFNQPWVLRHLILHRNVVRLAEEVDIEGDVELLFDQISYMRDLVIPWTIELRLMRQAFRLPRHHAENKAQVIRARNDKQQNTKQSISHHYDVGNDFYRMWLDEEMVYSCGYFSGVEQTLDESQRDKLDYICRKLRLPPGQTLLDIGCGWGGAGLLGGTSVWRKSAWHYPERATIQPCKGADKQRGARGSGDSRIA